MKISIIIEFKLTQWKLHSTFLNPAGGGEFLDPLAYSIVFDYLLSEGIEIFFPGYIEQKTLKVNITAEQAEVLLDLRTVYNDVFDLKIENFTPPQFETVDAVINY